MTFHAERIQILLAKGPMAAQQLLKEVAISQPTLSRAIAAMGANVVRVRNARSIQYALRDTVRGLVDIPVYRVGTDGKIKRLGLLIPIRDDGFVMQQEDGATLHSQGIPWWLLDMRPQGFMGRAYATRHAQALGLPSSIAEWSDTQALRALLAHGHDAVGNILLGDLARDRFVNAADPTAIPLHQKGEAYARLANEVASTGESWSSAAGEQPKFAAYSETVTGCSHKIVKFTLPEDNAITERWRDLLLAEHHALQTLSMAGVAAARSEVIDYGGQRFLEVERFDRVGATGRYGVFSLAAVDAEFAGMARSPWPVVTATLAAAEHIHTNAHDGAALLYAFGTLIGNTDMHHGNLSFVSAHGRPYALAPAYDMLPMGFQPRSGGALTDTLNPATLHAVVGPLVWRRAHSLATAYLTRLKADDQFSERFAPCIDSLATHISVASMKVERLAI
jgi:HipA-like C-terminal domain